ncbi:MAG: aldehyde dehydrogenase [Tissierellia bacterium]|nr:aldehyde dehydrogenase [Tissierellia bacterium]
MDNREYIDLIVNKQKAFFNLNSTKDIYFRIEQLDKLKNIILEYEDLIIDSLYKDLGKSPFESYSTEIGMVLSEISHAQKNIKNWSKVKKVKTPLTNFKAKSYIYPEPYGNVLIISPWNYPLQLTLAPLLGAIAAGNTALIKPSSSSLHTSNTIEKMINENFPEEFIHVINMDSKSADYLLDKKFDYIFYTGSVSVGKLIMEKASKHLTPITLELGGKSPCIVDKEGNIDIFAKRIVWGKFLNAGQTCVAPDYVYVHKDIKDKLIENIVKYIEYFYGKNIKYNDEYPRIINKKQFNRLISLIDENKLIYGGDSDLESLYISPTIMDNITWDDPVMEDEIFGPILPLLEYESIVQVIEEIKKRPRPLALYVFSTNPKVVTKVINSLSFGGGCINDTVMHLANPHMPFGGIGNSGMGAYHGEYSFHTFTHYKSILDKSLSPDVDTRYPPYKGKLKWVKKFMK